VQQRAVKRHKNLRLLALDRDREKFRAAPLLIACKVSRLFVILLLIAVSPNQVVTSAIRNSPESATSGRIEIQARDGVFFFLIPLEHNKDLQKTE
jgi:hypothetical protein